MSEIRTSHGLAAKVVSIVVVAAASMGLGVSSAEAAVYKTYGSEQCPAGYKVYVRVELDSVGDVIYYRGNSTRTEYLSKHAVNHIYYYTPAVSGATVNWRVEGSKGIRTVSDGCYNPNVA